MKKGALSNTFQEGIRGNHRKGKSAFFFWKIHGKDYNIHVNNLGA